MSDAIIYPSIDLFLYDLKEGLGQDAKQIDQNRRRFWQKVYGDLDETSFEETYRKLSSTHTLDSGIIPLLETRRRDFPDPFDGYYEPLQLNDTYALHVDYSGKLDANGQANDDPQPLHNKPFFHLKQDLIQRLSQQTGTIGQTWLLWGQLTTPKTDTEIEEIAKDCYTQILSNYNWNRDIIGKGQLNNATLFELWYRPPNPGLSSTDFWQFYRQESYHLLIWLFPHDSNPDAMRTQVQATYYDWLRLFQYRHKIVWSYYQSQDQKSDLKQKYIDIQPTIQEIPQMTQDCEKNRIRLGNLQKTLKDNLINLSKYTLALNALQNQSRTLTINLENYHYRLQSMQKKYPRSDLTVLEEFSSELYAQKYQRQVASDCENFQPGLTLLENLNSTLQGIINVEQTKSDRALNNTIALAGIVLGISGLTATAISVQQPQPKSYTDVSFLSSPIFIWSLGLSAPFLIALLYRLIAHLWRR
ncbi:MAG: hypothetical protein RH949_26190 [Coleofasciculus sp. A1-SPW-01]|uniref:hypothetical protein n=1 Tax=Coleofasciculus sp. A1-SPW-01 TaxID=3070819 RepID=UPI003304CD18